MNFSQKYFFIVFTMILAFSSWWLAIFLGKDNNNFDLNIPYHVARPLIIKNGWEPITSNFSETEGFLVQTYRDLGFPEIDDCSGTGFGYCRFIFKDNNGIYLKVTTREAPLGNLKPRFEETYDAIVVGYYIDDTPD